MAELSARKIEESMKQIAEKDTLERKTRRTTMIHGEDLATFQKRQAWYAREAELKAKSSAVAFNVDTVD